MEKRGLWICLDGPDYTGKKTQVGLLFKTLIGWDEDNIVITTHEPTRRAREIKKALASDPDPYTNGMQLLNLYTNDRVWDENEVIYPVVSIGGIAVSNRHKYSTDAFQPTQGIPLEVAIAMQKQKKIGTPDLTLFLLASPRVVAQRMRKEVDKTGKKLDKFERDLEFQIKVANQYRLLAKMAPKDPAYFGNIHIVNADLSPRVVARDIARIVKPVYEKWLAGLSYQDS
jgi:thymidylate kinase